MRTSLLFLACLFIVSGCHRIVDQSYPDQAPPADISVPSHPLGGSQYTTPELFLMLEDGSGERSLQPISTRAMMLTHALPDTQVIGVLPKGTSLSILGASTQPEPGRVWLGYQGQRFVFTMANVTTDDIQWFVTGDECQQTRPCSVWLNEIQRCLNTQPCRTFFQFELTDEQGQHHRNRRPPFPQEMIDATLQPVLQYSQQQEVPFEADPVLLEGIMIGNATTVAHLFFHQKAFNLKRDGIYATQ